MKKFIYFFLFFLVSLAANSQVQRPSGTPSPNSVSGFMLYGYVKADSGYLWKQRDTFPAKFPTIIWHTNGNFYKSNGNGGAWSIFASSTAGTVSSVSGNAPISVANGTTTPTISADTSYNGLATKKWLYKTVDSLGFIKLNISDTAAMLLTRLKVSDTAFMLSPYLRKSDTATLLSGYARKTININTNAPLIGGGDLSANRTISADTGRAVNQLVTGGSLTAVKDTLLAVIASSGGGTVLSVSTTNGVGINSSVATATSTPNITIAVDTFAISTRDWRNKGVDSAISVIPLRITDSLAAVNRIKAGTSAGGIVQTNNGAISFSWGAGGSQEVDFHGFAGYDANRSSTYTVRSFTDKRYVDSSLALRLLIGDTATMLSPYRRTSTKITNSDLVNSTISGVSLGSNLATLTFGEYLQVGASSYNGSTATTITTNGTSTNAGSTLVARDINGDFAARNITATLLGNASSSSTVSVTNDITTNATYYPMFSTNVSGNISPRVSSSKLTFNPSNGNLTATTFTGNLVGNATTASALQTARTINGVAFDGTANITISASVDSSLSAGYGITGSPFNGSLGRTWIIDTANISTKANVNGLLVGYTTTAQNALKLNISDTAAMLAGYRTYYPRNAISAGSGISYDPATGVISNTNPSLGTVTSVATNNGTGITGGTITSSGTLAIDTLLISTRAWRQKGVDSLNTLISAKLNISDTASMLANRLKISDTANMLSPYRRTSTKIKNSDLANSTISGVPLGSNLGALTAGNGLTGTTYNGNTGQTWVVDTSIISTKNNVTGALVAKLNISDTAAMLSNRLKISDTATMLANRLKISDTATMLSPYARTANLPSLAPYLLKADSLSGGYTTWNLTKKKIDSLGAIKVNYTDTAAIVANYLRKSDTATMLSPYLRKSDTATMLLPFVQYSDTANQMSGYLRNNFALLLQDTASAFNNYLRKSDTLTMLANRLKISDTANMLSPYRRTSTLIQQSEVNGLTTSLNSKLNISDTSAMLSNRLKISDTLTMLSPYARTANLPSLAPYVKYTDTAALVAPYLLKSDTSTMLSNRVKYSDTANIVANYLRKSDTSTMLSPYTRVQRFTDSLTAVQGRIQTKLAIADTSTMLSGYTRLTRFTDSLTAVQARIQTKQNILTNPVTGTGTSGQIAYWNGTTTQTGTNNLFWDNTNARLGIGTTTPQTNLSIVGASPTFRISATDSMGAATVEIFGLSGNKVTSAGTRIQSLPQNSVNGETATTISNRNVSNNFIEALRIDGQQRFGITTTAPEATLHINRPLQGSEGAYIFIDNSAPSSLGNKAGIRFATNGGATFTNYGSFIEAVNTTAGNGAEALTFGTWNGSSRGERMRIASGGELLLNTTLTNGIDRLQVAGNGFFSGTVKALNATFTNSNQITRINNSSTLFLNNTNSDLTSGQAQTMVFGKANSLNNVGAVRYIHSADGSTENRVSIGFWGNDDKLNVLASGRVLVNKTSDDGIHTFQVLGGIGSSSANTFDISSGLYNARFRNTSASTSETNVIRFTQPSASGSAIGLIGTGASAASNLAFRNTFVVGTQSENDFVIVTNDIERFRMNATTGATSFTNGLTAQRGRFTSLVMNKDSIPITTSNFWALQVDTSGTPYTNRINRRDISAVHTGSISFDTAARTLTINQISGGTTSVVIPRGTASGTSGITALSSTRTGNLVTVSGDNGSSTIFSVRDADSSAALQSLTAGNGLTGSPYNGGSPLTWTVDTSIISTKNNVTGLLVGYATTAANALKVNISDTASMLSPYRRTSTLIEQSEVSGLSTSLAAKLNTSDTLSMLLPYLRKTDTLSMLSNYRRSTTLIENSNLRNSTISGVALGNNLNNLNFGNGLTGAVSYNGSASQSIRVDTSQISTKANVTGALVGKANTSLNNVNGVLSSTYGGAGSVSGLLKANGSGVVSAAGAGDITSLISGTYVDLTTNQTIGGNKTLSSFLSFSSPTASLGAGTTNSSWFEANTGTAFNVRISGGDRFRVSSTEAISTVPISGTSLSMSGGGSFGGRVQASGSNGTGTTQGGFLINYSPNASSRSWLINDDYNVFGDFAILQSTTQTGTTYDPKLYIGNDGTIVVNGTTPDGSNKLIVNGGVKATSSVTATANASGRSGLFGGSTYGLRIDNEGSFNNGGTTLHGVDNTFTASYQKLSLNGSSLELMTDYATRITISNTGETTFSSSGQFGGTVSSQVSNGGGDGGIVFIKNSATTTLNNKAVLAFATDPGGTATNNPRIQAILKNTGNGASDLEFFVHAGAGTINKALTLASDQAATFSSSVTASSLIKSGGTSSQALIADGSVISVATAATASTIAYRDGSGNLTAVGFFESSDLRLKNVISRDEDVAYFKWKDGKDTKTHIGYIAQEVQKTNPDQVKQEENGYLSVNYTEILVQKVRDLERKLEKLERELKTNSKKAKTKN